MDEFDDETREEIEFYREIIDTLENWNWELKEKDAVSTASDILEDGQTRIYGHEYDPVGLTRARFDISAEEGEPLIEGTLAQPLDTTLPEKAFRESFMLQAYLRKIDSIVEERGNEYTETVGDPDTVMEFELPRQHHEDLEPLLYTISDVSNQVQAIHEAMTYPLEDFWPETRSDFY